MRCGTSYVFQIRLPKDLGGGRSVAPIRIGIGARPASDARRFADILAGAARTGFARIKARRMSGDEERAASEIEQLFSGEDDREARAEMRGYLKATLRFVDREPPQPSADQMRAFTGLKGLVGIAREIEKGSDGNPLVIDNAELLKGKYVDMFAGTALTPTAPATGPSSANLASSAAAMPSPAVVEIPPNGDDGRSRLVV